MKIGLLRRWEGDEQAGYSFFCPGCKGHHSVVTSPGGWGFNENPESPTFTPSVLVKGGHFAEGWTGPDCWCNFEARTGQKTSFQCRICHSYVTDGQIQFLADSTHFLAGQTVALPDYPEEWT